MPLQQTWWVGRRRRGRTESVESGTKMCEGQRREERSEGSCEDANVSPPSEVDGADEPLAVLLEIGRGEGRRDGAEPAERKRNVCNSQRDACRSEQPQTGRG